jgi:steroid 5-alpha reductase family enzyme
MGQALWVWITLLPVLILNGSRADNNFQWSDAVGAVLWVVGFACEATADLQKSAFKSKPENKGKFINTGAHMHRTRILFYGSCRWQATTARIMPPQSTQHHNSLNAGLLECRVVGICKIPKL